MTDPADIPKTTMHFIASHLFAWDSSNDDSFDAEDRWVNMPAEERQEWYNRAVALIDIAEPVWRARIGTEYEYGIRVKLSEEAHGPDKFVISPTPSEQVALSYRDDERTHITPVRRIKTEWTEF